MDGPYDIICILWNERASTFQVMVFRNADPHEDRGNIRLRGTLACEEDPSYDQAADRMRILASKLGVLPENIARDVVYPYDSHTKEWPAWTVPNWKRLGKPFTKVFPGRPAPRPVDGWGQLLNDDFG